VHRVDPATQAGLNSLRSDIEAEIDQPTCAHEGCGMSNTIGRYVVESADAVVRTPSTPITQPLPHWSKVFPHIELTRFCPSGRYRRFLNIYMCTHML
jgi:hypothetical protein